MVYNGNSDTLLILRAELYCLWQVSIWQLQCSPASCSAWAVPPKGGFLLISSCCSHSLGADGSSPAQPLALEPLQALFCLVTGRSSSLWGSQSSGGCWSSAAGGWEGSVPLLLLGGTHLRRQSQEKLWDWDVSEIQKSALETSYQSCASVLEEGGTLSSI